MDEVTCWVCREEYWTGMQEPLLLPCGHTFCRKCVLNLVQARHIKCPTCRRGYHSLIVNKLPKNYAVLSIAMSKNMIDTCSVHGDRLRFWCSDCEERGCGECMFDAHPKGQHLVVNDRVMLHEKKESLKNQVGEIFQVINEEVARREADFRSCEANMLRLLKRSRDIYSLDNQLRNMLHEINSSTGMIHLNSEAAKLEALQEKIDITLVRFNEENNEISVRGSESSGGRCERGTAASGTMRLLGMQITNFDGRESRLVWQNGRLLLRTTPYKVPRQPVQVVALDCLVTLEMPEVFLELSVGQVILGKVYIQLWSHLRRAQHFLALCLGTLGPSFVGAKLLKVTCRNDPEESVTCGDYIALDGDITAKAMMTDLEWDGEYAGERCEGLVVASSGGEQELDSRFGISTSRRARGWVKCPFAQVVSGLEVVRKTLKYDYVGQVSVSGCGLVLKREP